MNPQTSDKTREFRRLLTVALALRSKVADQIERGVPRAALFGEIDTYRRILATARKLLVVSIAFLACMFTTCCVHYPRPVPGQTSEIGFKVKPEIRVQFKRNAGGDYNAIVQETVFDDGKALVECFKCEVGEIVWDRHAWSAENEVRHMKCYLAKVDGVDWDWKGFAHLPQNMDGSVKTTVGPWFNAGYQAKYETKGRVVARSLEYFTWSLDAGLQRVAVEAP